MMKTHKLKYFVLIASVCTLSACSIFKNSAPVYEVDPVCHMKVDKAEAYTYKYKDVEYYFDNINCRESFKMDPEAVLKKNSCDVKK